MLMSSSKDRKATSAGLRTHFRTPLYRNGYALTLGSVATSGLGIVYWIMAARYYSADVVGLSSAIISAMMLLAGVAVFSLSDVLVRFIPQAGRATRRLVIYAYTMSTLIALVVSFFFSRSIGLWSPKLRFLSEDALWASLFVAATIAWCVFSLQDSVLTGLRQTLWIPIENIIFSIVKIILLVIFAELLPGRGIFAAWTIPVFVALLPINFLLFRYLIPRHIQENGSHEGSLIPGELIRYISGNYIGTLFYLASTTLLPLIVTQQAGVRANAYFYIPWMIAGGLQLISLHMTTSLTVEASHDTRRLELYCYRILLQIIRLLALPVIVILLSAPLILRVFGDDYAREGALLLRLLVVAALPNIFVILYISLVRIQNRASGVMWVQGAQCLLLLSVSYLLLPRYGIMGVGLASLLSQTCLAVLLSFTQLRSILQNGRAQYRYEQVK